MELKDLNVLRTAVERFVGLTDVEWQMLVPDLRYRNLTRAEQWICEGQKEQNMGIVLEGNMRHFYTRDGEEKTTYFYFESHLVGSYFSAITDKPSLLTIEALTDCRLLTFSYAHLQSLYDKSPKWERFGRLLAEYLALGLEERMAGLLTLSPEARYVQLLEGNKRKIIERIPQHYIANYLGITPVSLSRIRKRLAEK